MKMTEDKPSRVCRECRYVHPYETPIYCCLNCRTWGQDFYELRPPGTKKDKTP